MSTLTINIEQGGTLILPKSLASSPEQAKTLVEGWLHNDINVETTSGDVTSLDMQDRQCWPLADDEVIDDHYGFMVSMEAVVIVDTPESVEEPESFAYENLAFSFENVGALCHFDIKHTDMVSLDDEVDAMDDSEDS